MGIAGLWKLVEDASETWSLRTLTIREGFEGTRPERLYYLGIDASIWIHTMLHALSSSYPQSGENCQLRHMFSRLAMLAERPIHAVFVADGRQRPTYKRGKQVKPAEVWLTDGLRRMVEAFGFGWLEAAGEAEAELSRMASLGLIDAVMTDDSDTLVFGATVVIRNPSFKRTGSDKVSVYRRTNILDKTGLSTDDLFLFALLVGCDYDQEGLRNCGPKVAEGLARYGLGRTLRRALDTYNDEQLAQYLVVWRDQVRSRLRDDPHGYIGRKHPQLAANIPPTFPKLEAARLLASPVLLANTSYDAVLRPRPIDFGQLGAACERHFGWGSAAEIRKTFRTALWPCELIRMLLSEGLSREGIASKVGRARSLLDVSYESAGKLSASGYMMCQVEVTDTGLGDAATTALHGTRPYSSTAEVSEEDVLQGSKESLSTRVPAVILERARPWLITPAYKTDGYKYGHGGCDLRGGNVAASSLPVSRPRPTKKKCTSSRRSQGSAGVQRTDSPSSALDSLSPPSPSSHTHTSSSQTIPSPSSSRTVALSSSPTVKSPVSSGKSASASSRPTKSMAWRTSGSVLTQHHGAATPSPLTALYSYFSLTPPSTSSQLSAHAGTSSLHPASSSLHPASSSMSSRTSASTSSLHPATSSMSTRIGASPSSMSTRTGASMSSMSSRTSAPMSSLHPAMSSMSPRTGASTAALEAPQYALEIPEVLDDIIDLTVPSPTPRPRRARKLYIIDLAEEPEDVIDLTVD